MNPKKEKLSILPFVLDSNHSFRNHNNQVILQDLMLKDIEILNSNVDPTEYWERRVLATDFHDYSSRKLFTKWDITFVLGCVKSPIFCDLENQSEIENDLIMTIEKIDSKNDQADLFEIDLTQLEKIPLVNHKGSIAFTRDDWDADSKINIEITQNSKVIQQMELFAKSLVEIHKYHFLEINELPNWNDIRSKVFENVFEKFLTVVIDKGMKKPHYKTLIENNIDYFKDFFRKKTHQIINEILTEKVNLERLIKMNRSLQCDMETEFKPQIIAQQSEKAIALLLKTINKKITYFNLTNLSDVLTNIILSSVPIKEQLLKYFNEFLSFLITF